MLSYNIIHSCYIFYNQSTLFLPELNKTENPFNIYCDKPLNPLCILC